MTLSHRCIPCIMRQIGSLTELLHLDEQQALATMEFAMQQLLQRSDATTTQHILRSVYDYLHTTWCTESAVFDPYDQLKIDANRRVHAVLPLFQAMIRRSRDPLRLAVRGAAAGNIIDYGALATNSIPIEQEIARIPELEFAVEEIEVLHKEIRASRIILYIADNAGELLFDGLLIHEILTIHPRAQVYLAVRHAPIINDATLEDTAWLKLPDGVQVISSGSIYPGTILPETTPEFQDLFSRADTIIAKGQGNFETLCGEPHPALFYLLRIKCQPVAALLAAPEGKLVLTRTSGNC